MTRFGITGHQSLPPATEALVLAEMRSRLVGNGSLVGISSLAQGADQLFADTVLLNGGTLEVVVPCQGYEKTFQTPDIEARYSRLLREASTVEVLDFPEPSEDAFLAAGRRIADRSECLLAVWDGEPAAGLGGTADVVEYARKSGRDVHIIWPDGATRSQRS